jgi:hypothetical protein
MVCGGKLGCFLPVVSHSLVQNRQLLRARAASHRIPPVPGLRHEHDHVYAGKTDPAANGATGADVEFGRVATCWLNFESLIECVADAESSERSAAS